MFVSYYVSSNIARTTLCGLIPECLQEASASVDGLAWLAKCHSESSLQARLGAFLWRKYCMRISLSLTHSFSLTADTVTLTQSRARLIFVACNPIDTWQHIHIRAVAHNWDSKIVNCRQLTNFASCCIGNSLKIHSFVATVIGKNDWNILDSIVQGIQWNGSSPFRTGQSRNLESQVSIKGFVGITITRTNVSNANVKLVIVRRLWDDCTKILR